MNAKALAPRSCCLPVAAFAQGYAGLGTDAGGYAPVTAPADLAFPRDHGPHPGFRIEWWYVTANLTGPDGTAYGVQWTLFRQATAPGPDRPGWASPQLWMAHAAATSATEPPLRRDLRPRRHRPGRRHRRAVPRLDRRLEHDRAPAHAGDALAGLRLTAGGDGFAYDLALAADQPPVPQGEPASA